jgi:hypothetical protein
MSYLQITDINNWLAITKYSVSEVNSGMEDAAVALVFGALDTRYDIAVWVDEASTPDLIQSVLAMLIAAWEYDRAVGEDDGEGQSYASRLERRAMQLLGALADGSIVVPGVIQQDIEGPAFFPTDDSTTLFDSDPHNPDATPMAFSMNKVF